MRGRDGGHTAAGPPGTRGASLSSGAPRASGPHGPVSPHDPLSPHGPLSTFAPPGTNLGPTPGHSRDPGTNLGPTPGHSRHPGTNSAPAPAHSPGHCRSRSPSHHPGRHPGTTPGKAGKPGKLLAGVAWAVLLLGLWLWGRDLAGGVAAQLATTGDVAAVGRPLGRQAPPHAHAPLPAAVTAEPVGITIDALGVREGGIAARGLDEHGILTPPPDTSPALVGWYAEGPQPGEAGAALLVGRAAGDRDPRARQTLVHRLAALKPGERVDIQRSDGSTARFTVEDVQLYDHDRFDARRAYAARDRGRSELRLIVDDGGHGPAAAPRARGDGVSNVVVVSAYLTSLQAADARGG
ncbi:sortase domain-bontaining protein [Streptomyces sp. NPDC015125]|uniref:sortase domain-containing protein n=1 Tax=Streptomyces sp. NPDC015125 TaxID=3364938 RepID=UPI0036FA3405